MTTASPHNLGREDDGSAATQASPVHDPLNMLVTGEPVAELDAVLLSLHRQLQLARNDPPATARLRRWIDRRLDERNNLQPALIRTSESA